jgi:hypothetical protein
MTAFRIWASLGEAFEDVLANKLYAAQTYAAILAFSLVFGAASLFFTTPDPAAMRQALPKLLLFDMIGFAAMILIYGWVLTRWAGLAEQCATSREPEPHRYWPVVRAMLKLVIALGLLFTAVFMVMVFGAILGKLSRVMGLVGAGVMLLAILAWIWIFTRLSVLPFRAAIGDGTSLGDCWRATKGAFWRLFGLYWAAILLLLLNALVVGIIVFILAAAAIHIGLIDPITDTSPLGIGRWYRTAVTSGIGLRGTILIAAVIAAPVTASVYLTIYGAYTRAALALRASANALPNPWAA